MLTIVLNAPISIGVHGLHHIFEEMVRILQSYQRVLAIADRIQRGAGIR